MLQYRFHCYSTEVEKNERRCQGQYLVSVDDSSYVCVFFGARRDGSPPKGIYKGLGNTPRMILH